MPINTDSIIESAASAVEGKGKMEEKKNRVTKPEKNIPQEKPLETVAQLTAEESAIAARVAADNAKEWETIGEDSAIDYSLGRWIFELPEPAQKMVEEKRFAFRWVKRVASRIDEIRSKQAPFRWWICNRANTPFLSAFVDPVLGGVIREDQILVFQPYWMSVKRQEIKNRVSGDRTQDITRLHGEGKDGVNFVAGKRRLGDSEVGQFRQEMKTGDVSVYDGDAEEAGVSSGVGLDDLTTEE